MEGFDSTLTGQQVQEAVEKVEHLNLGFVDASSEVEEAIPPYKGYVDNVIGDINAILDNINGEII